MGVSGVKPNPALMHFMQSNKMANSSQQLNMNSKGFDGALQSASRNRINETVSKSQLGNPVRANSVIKQGLSTQRGNKSSSKLGVVNSSVDIRGSIVPNGQLTKSFILVGNSPHLTSSNKREYNLKSSRNSQLK